MRRVAVPTQQTIYLDQEDDLVSVCDRLSWAAAERVYLVLPDEGDLLTERLDLVQLRRQADELNLEIGLVTADGRVRGPARELGFPTFATASAAERSRRRTWRQARRARFRAYQGTARSLIGLQDRAEVRRRRTRRPDWQRWLLRYVGIIAFFLTLALAVVGIAYTLPTATITLEPLVEPLQAERQIVADPQLESVSFSGASVPARQLTVTSIWQATVETTGQIEIPDAPARGTVVFANTLDEPATVPAGTRVTTSSSQRLVFQTLREIEVPGVVGATAETEIVAVEPGLQGNVDLDQINRVEGTLSLQLAVRNLEPTTGGGVREAGAVTQNDVDRLRAQVLQFVQALAASEMEALLTEREFLAQDSLSVVEIYQETYSHFVGDVTDRLTLEIRAEIVGTAVDETEANDLIYDELAQNVLPGYEIVPDSLRFYSGDVLGVDNQGRVSFLMLGEGQMAATLDLAPRLETIAGQPPELAMAYLEKSLPLRSYPTVRIAPAWFERLPYVPVRIQVQVDTSG